MTRTSTCLLGVELNGAANLLQGVHTWNDGTTAQGCTAGHGIIVEAPSSRMLNVYLDYTALVIASGSKNGGWANGTKSHVSVANSFFLGMGTIVLKVRSARCSAASGHSWF